MKRTKAAIYLCTALLLATVPGCGASGDGEAAPAAMDADIDHGAADETGNDSDNEGSLAPAPNTPSEAEMPEDSEVPAGAEETITGSVKSIGDNSIVLSKAEVISEQEMVAMVGDSPNEDLVTVRFSENTEFVVETVKNNGINGDSDVESRKGSFSDLKEQSSLDLTGSYEGEDFLASQVILYIFL